MTQILTSFHDKYIVLNEIDRLIYRHLLVGMNPTQRLLTEAHMAAVRRDPRPMHVNFRFETVPELNSTRIHLEFSFDSVPSFDDPAQKKI